MTQAVIHWWVLFSRGLAGVFLGVISFSLPDVALTALVFMFAVYCGTNGVLNLFAAWEQGSWWSAGQGLFGIAAALITFVWPGVTALVMLYLIAAWTFCAGVFELVTAFRLRRVQQREWILVLLGVLSILFAVLLMTSPLAGAVVLAVWFGAYATVHGALLLVAAWRMRRLGAPSQHRFRPA